jgi:putative inorganic carbon (HCO3(-)) transporter
MKSKASLNTTKAAEPATSRIKPAYYALMVAYLVAPVYVPSFDALDTNGPKFLALGIVNLFALFVFFNDKDLRKRSGRIDGFFRSAVGLAYTAFILISLLSFVNAITPSESIVSFAKLFTVFSSAFALYLIFSSNRTYLQHAALLIVLLLLVDCLSVFYNILEYIEKEIDSIFNIQSVYSNKNILTAAIFIKMPAALWLLLFSEKWKKGLGWAGILSGIIAILFMSSRAFYLGLALLVIAVALFFTVRFLTMRKSLSFKKVMIYLAIFAGTLALFTVVQKTLFPKNQDLYNKSIIERFTSEKGSESRANGRLNNWKRSFMLIGENPVLGVGTGNWKVRVLKYESPAIDGYFISYKNHNDFLEVTTETGLLGGLAYLSIFLFILLGFVKKIADRRTDEETLKLIFLPAFGILAYSVDAFFNFPNDRPEIQSLFAVYVAIAVAYGGISLKRASKSAEPQEKVTRGVPALPINLVYAGLFTLLAASGIVFGMYVKSLHYQKLIYYDEQNNKYSYSSSFLSEGFPAIPAISCLGAPINTIIARYLANENKLREAVDLLLRDHSSPWDGRRETFLSIAYDKLGMKDSVLFWTQKAYELKPLFAPIVLSLSSKEFANGRTQEAFDVIEKYLSKVKTNEEAWLLAAKQYYASGNDAGAIAVMDSAMKYIPGSEKILTRSKGLKNEISIKPYQNLLDEAGKAGQTGRYDECLRLINDFISKKPEYREAYKIRGMCYFSMGKYAESLKDIETTLRKGNDEEAILLNLLGSAYGKLGDPEAACIAFKQAADKGSAEGVSNYRKYCQPAQTTPVTR